MNFFYPAGKRLLRLDCKLAEQVSESSRIRFAFAKIFQHGMGHGEPAGRIRGRAIGNGNLQPPIKHRADAFQLGERQGRIFTGYSKSSFIPSSFEVNPQIPAQVVPERDKR